MLQSNLTKNHYQTLSVDRLAPLTEIKLAYRKIAKQFHPDCNPSLGNHEKIIAINLAYEVLSNPQSRAKYDLTLGMHSAPASHSRRPRKTYQDEDRKFDLWYKQVYKPVIEMVADMVESLDLQIEQLADDPFDDQLMADFEFYLDDCRRSLTEAQSLFRKVPNPKAAAGVAEYLYYALSHLGDGMEELNYFTRNFDDRHLHTGQEMWRLVEEMSDRAQSVMSGLLH
jgi:molecular chaperone DnaJ